MDGRNGMKPSEANPSTTVHKLVSSLNEYVDWAISMIICETATYLSHPVSHYPQAAISRCADAPGLAMQLPRVLKMSKIPILRFTELPLLRQTQIFRPICTDCLRHLRISTEWGCYLAFALVLDGKCCCWLSVAEFLQITEHTSKM